jgi:hypothetical protein
MHKVCEARCDAQGGLNLFHLRFCAFTVNRVLPWMLDGIVLGEDFGEALFALPEQDRMLHAP